MKKSNKILLIIFLLNIAIYLITSLVYYVPLGNDTVRHALFIKDIESSGYISDIHIDDPTVVFGGISIYPKGFHLFMYVTKTIAGLDVFSMFKYLIPVLASLTVFSMFILAKYLFGTEIGLWTAFLTATSSNFLRGISWGGYPYSLGLFFVPLTLYVVLKTLDKKSATYGIISIALICFVFLMHNYSSMALTICLVILLITNLLIKRWSLLSSTLYILGLLSFSFVVTYMVFPNLLAKRFAYGTAILKIGSFLLNPVVLSYLLVFVLLLFIVRSLSMKYVKDITLPKLTIRTYFILAACLFICLIGIYLFAHLSNFHEITTVMTPFEYIKNMGPFIIVLTPLAILHIIIKKQVNFAFLYLLLLLDVMFLFSYAELIYLPVGTSDRYANGVAFVAIFFGSYALYNLTKYFSKRHLQILTCLLLIGIIIFGQAALIKASFNDTNTTFPNYTAMTWLPYHSVDDNIISDQSGYWFSYFYSGMYQRGISNSQMNSLIENSQEDREHYVFISKVPNKCYIPGRLRGKGFGEEYALVDPAGLKNQDELNKIFENTDTIIYRSYSKS